MTEEYCRGCKIIKGLKELAKIEEKEMNCNVYVKCKIGTITFRKRIKRGEVFSSHMLNVKYCPVCGKKE